MSEYLLYLDESGVANLAQYEDRFFIVTTLIVEVGADNELSGYLKHLKRRYGFNEAESLHAFELFENSESSSYLVDNKKCKNFTESITEFIENASFTIKVYAINKESLRGLLKTPEGYKFKGSRKHSEDKDFPYEILAKQIIFDYSTFLKKNKGKGAIIAESRGNADSVVIRSFNDAQSNNSSDKESIKKKKQNVRDTIHSICFANKKSVRSGLELVDIISYCANLQLSNRIKKRDSRGIKQMWEKIKKKLPKQDLNILTNGEINGLNKDKVHKISERIQSRMKEFRDLVNPTIR